MFDVMKCDCFFFPFHCSTAYKNAAEMHTFKNAVCTVNWATENMNWLYGTPEGAFLSKLCQVASLAAFSP